MQKTQDPDIESHISIEDMAKLMGDDPLKLIASESLYAPSSDTHDRVLRGRSGRKGIDPLFVLQEVYRWNGRARGQCHLFDHIEQNTLAEIPSVGLNFDSTELKRNGGSIAREEPGLINTSRSDHQSDREKHSDEDQRIEDIDRFRITCSHRCKQRDDHKVDQRHDDQDGQTEVEYQSTCVFTRLILMCEKVHCDPSIQSSLNRSTLRHGARTGFKPSLKLARTKP